MKKIITLIVLTLHVFFALGQTAYINGANNSVTTVCNSSNKLLTAGISGGFITGDSLMWVQQINGNTPIVVAANVPYVNDTITMPRNISIPYAVGTAIYGNTYFYTLNIKRGTNTYSANITVMVNPSPTVYNVTGGGNYCTGGTGTAVGLSGSDAGTKYQLFCNSIPIGATSNGTGGSISFGSQTLIGMYTVQATIIATGCIAWMNGSTVIGTSPIPSVTISASGPTTFCSPGSVILSASTASGNTFQWQNNGSTIVGAINNQYVATSTAMYKVIVTNSYGCTNSHDTLVTVNPLPQQFTVSASSSTFCQGGTGVVINLNGSQLGTNYQLQLNSINVGSPIAGTGFALAWPGQTSGGTYTLQAVNPATLCSNMMIGASGITMNPLPAAADSIFGPTTVCQGMIAVYSTASIINAMNYVWSIPIGSVILNSTGTSITLKFGSNSGTISVHGHNACNDGQSSSLAITVNLAPIIFNVTANPSNVCAGSNTNLTVNTNGTSFLWSAGLGINNSVTTTPSNTTTYFITVTGSNGCSSKDSVKVMVNPLPVVSLALTQNKFCGNIDKVKLTGGSPFGGIYTAPSGCYITSGDTLHPTLSSVGTYPITYTFTYSVTGCSNSATDLLAIEPLPEVNFYSIPGTITTSTPPFYLTGYVNPIGGIFSGPGMIGSLFNPVIAGPGMPMITYIYTDPSTGCSATDVQWIPVGITGIDKIIASVNAISIYPNPAKELLNLTGIDTKKISSLEIINILGETVYAAKTDNESMTINVSDFANGIYVINFINANGIFVGRKFMKQ